MVGRETSENATSSSLVLPSRQTLRARSGYSGLYRVGRPRRLMPPFSAALAGGNNQAPEPGVWLFDHQYSGVWHPDGHNRNDASKRCSRKMAAGFAVTACRRAGPAPRRGRGRCGLMPFISGCSYERRSTRNHGEGFRPRPQDAGLPGASPPSRSQMPLAFGCLDFADARLAALVERPRQLGTPQNVPLSRPGRLEQSFLRSNQTTASP
jgi:hypothetical protein